MAGGIAPHAAKILVPGDNRPISNLKDLFLSRCHINQEDFDVILRGIKDLKTLYYTDGGVQVSPDEQYLPKRTIQVATGSVGHCLEELVLHQTHYGDPVSCYNH
jgi:hypothetical protein